MVSSDEYSQLVKQESPGHHEWFDVLVLQSTMQIGATSITTAVWGNASFNYLFNELEQFYASLSLSLEKIFFRVQVQV